MPQGIQPRPHQVEAIKAIDAAYGRGLQRIGIQAPTAYGKTILFSIEAKAEVDRGGKVLIIAHRDELIQQAEQKFRAVHGDDIKVGICKASRNELECQVVVSSIQTICRDKRLAEVILHEFTYVIVDEAHHIAGDSYQKVIRALGCFNPGGPKLLCVSATLRREDKQNLGDTIQEVVYECSILDLIQGKYLKNIKALKITLKNLDLDHVHSLAGDFAQDELDAALNRADAPSHIVGAYQEHALGRKAVVFSSSVKSAYNIAETFVANGVQAIAIDGTNTDEVRRAKLNDFANGKYPVLVNCALLTEGWDAPDVDCVIMASPTKSTTKFVQCIGRGLRQFPGKDTCLLLDVTGVSTKHSLVNAATLFNVREQELAKGGLLFATNMRLEREAAEEERISGFRVAVPVDMFRKAGEQVLNWLTGLSNTYILPTPSGVVEVYKTNTVSESGPTQWGVKVKTYSETTVLSENIDLGYAQGIAEDYVRNLGSIVLSNPNAPWRKTAPSHDQLAILTQYGYKDFPENFTKGMASDLIAVHKAEKIGQAPAWTLEPATPAQVGALKRAKVIIPVSGITKGDASRIINDLKKAGVL